MGYLLVACRGPAPKSRGQGRVSCTDTPPPPPLSQTCQFECHVVFLLTVFVESFGLAWMFCVDMAPCWRGPCHVLAWGGGGCSPSQGGGQNSPGHCYCLRVNCGHVFANTVRYIYQIFFKRL